MSACGILIPAVCLLLGIVGTGVGQIQPAYPPTSDVDDARIVELQLQNLMIGIRSGDRGMLEQILDRSSASNLKKPKQVTESSLPELNAGALGLTISDIRIEENSAAVSCTIQDGTDMQVFSERATFIKENGRWRIVDAPLLLKLSNQIANREGRSTLGTSTIPTLVNSDKALIPIPHPLTPRFSDDGNNTYVINKTYSYNNITRYAFSDNCAIDLEGVYTSLNTNEFIAFFLDRRWDRIVTAQRSGNWVKSYGDWSGQYGFHNPSAMSADARDSIYVVDSDRKSVVKLYVNPTNGAISYVSSFTLPGIANPVDISIVQEGGYSSPTLDRIWIADDGNRKLVQIDRSGNIFKTITHYTIGGQTYPVSKPTKILASENYSLSPYLGFIDGVRNAFVVVDPNLLSGTTVTALNSYEFTQSGSRLSSVGQSITCEWWVGDAGLGKIHIFSTNGVYIASFSRGLVPAPQAICKAPRYFTSTNTYRSQYLYTSDLWNSSTGMRAFLPGADVVNVYVARSGYNVIVRFTTTNLCYLTAYIDRIGPGSCSLLNGRQYTLLNNVSSSAQTYNWTLDASTWYNDDYKLHIEVLPYFNSSYGLDALPQPNAYNYTFPYYPEAFGVQINGPAQLSSGESGTWTFNISGRSGSDYSYYWSYKEDNASSWVNQGTSTSQQRTMGSVGFTERIEVYDRCLQQTVSSQKHVSLYTAPPPGGGCPYVYSWNGDSYVEDNNILPQSEYPGNQGKDVTDYYLLRTPVVKKGGSYRLQIHEFEHEKSFFDEAKLIPVDHQQGLAVQVTDNGEVVSYEAINASPSVRLNGRDISPELERANGIALDAGDTISVELERNVYKTSQRSTERNTVTGLLMIAQSIPKDDRTAHIWVSEGDNNLDNRRATEGKNISFRQRPTTIFVPISGAGAKQVHVIWDKISTVFSIRLASLVLSSTTLAEQLRLVNAAHSSRGDVTERIARKDGIYTTLEPGECIDLQLSSLSLPKPGTVRDFVLVSTGHYQKIEAEDQSRGHESLRPTAYELYPNHPNPFNPATKIRYDIPVDGYTALRIYNVLGQEVSRLVGGFQQAGSYEIEFNANQLVSGVYVYSLKSGSYNSSRKMLLLK